MTAAQYEGRIRAALNTLRNLHAQTFAPDVPKQAGGPTTKPGSKPPAPIGPISARRHARDLTTDLITLKVDETGCALPERGSTPERCRWLLERSGWYAQHDTAESTTLELEHAARLYEQITTPPAGKHVPVGVCPEEACDGQVRVWVPADGSGDVTAACDAHQGHTWTRGEWAILAKLQGDDAPALLTAVELAQWMSDRLGARVTHRHVWNWAKRYPQVVAVEVAGETRYDRTAVALWWLERRERVA